MDMRFGYPPQMSLPQNISVAGGGSPMSGMGGSAMPGMGGFPGMGAMMQQRPQARPSSAFACS